MVFFLLLLLVIAFIGASPSGIKEFNTDYLNKRNTTSINGIFVILIVFSHFRQYAAFDSVYDEPYLMFCRHVGQMVVANFWFYSGYGMMEAIRRKGDAYVRGILSKFWKLLLRFDTAVILFLLLGLALGREFTASQVLLSLTAYSNIGNSNWYIFDILIEYLLMYAAFRLTAKAGRYRNIAGIITFLILTVGFVFAMMKFGLPDYFYNTVVLMPVGALFSECRKGIEKVLLHSDITFSLGAMIVAGIYIVSYIRIDDYGIKSYTIWALAFTAAVILFTMKMSICNPVLEWFGAHIFSIYILQRLPMMVLKAYGCVDSHPYLCLLAVFAITVPLALVFEKATDKMIALIEGAAGKKQVS